jgi:hypothetical protein
MSMTMKLLAIPLVAGLILVLSGCLTTPTGCAGVIVPTANPQYAGHFTGSFKDGQVPLLTFDIELANDGLVIGTVHRLSGGDASVTGDIRDWDNCGSISTAASLTFTFPSESPSTVSVARGKGQSEPWIFQGRYGTVEGRLELNRQP